MTGFSCAVCGAVVDERARWPWRCPRATTADPYHVLVPPPASALPIDDPNPFARYVHRLAALRIADPDDRVDLVRRLDTAVASVEGHGFAVTPLARSDELSDALGFDPIGGVWVKDETGNVAGSHKARHLASIMLHLLATDDGRRPPLAIASCGNAAVAAATLAAATQWPLQVFVPPTADPEVLDRLRALGAELVTCARSAGDPAGDPCLHRFRAAVADGAIPFTVQGPENGLCLDGGRTIGWEIVDQLVELDLPEVDRAFVQVGGGALGASLAAGLADGAMTPHLHPVQTEGGAPLARAWKLAEPVGIATAARRWPEYMWPWDTEPHSAASGILDDETYDWVPLLLRTESSGGWPIVVPEAVIVEAHDVARRTTGIDVSATGSAGLAGLLANRAEVGDSERVLVVFSGRR